MTNILLVGSGGFLGSIARYLIGNMVLRISAQHWFPFATMTVNVLGCFFIGMFIGIMEAKQVLNDAHRLFLVVGFLGGFTTFSAFGLETVMLLKGSNHVAALANIIFSVILCLVAVWLGHYIARVVL